MSALPFLGAAVVFAAAGHLGLSLVPAVIGAGLSAAARGRAAVVALAAALLTGAGFLAVRLSTVRAPSGWSVCEGAECSAAGPWWSRLLPEQASADAGFFMATRLGLVRPGEGQSYARAFAGGFALLPDVPNAALLVSTGARVRRLVVEPAGTGPLPAVVFLHGFGGLSSSYVAVMERALAGRAVLVAPALDWGARWDSRRGRAVVEETLRLLPARVDRRRVVLVGLSNGAFFGAAHADLFHGAVLVSGVGEAPRGPVAVVSGEGDVRVPARVVREGAEALRRRGLEVELTLVPGADHGLLLTHPEAWLRPTLRLLAGR